LPGPAINSRRATWQELHSLDGHNSPVRCLAFSQDNRYLASGGFDKKICVWDATTGSKMLDLSGHADSVSSVTFSPNKKRLFSSDSAGSINVWDVQNRVKLLTLHQRGQFVATSPDGCRLASFSIAPFSTDLTTVQIWDSEVLSREGRWKRHHERIPFWQPQRATTAEPPDEAIGRDTANKTGR
jgi:WD40 repeat protein